MDRTGFAFSPDSIFGWLTRKRRPDDVPRMLAVGAIAANPQKTPDKNEEQDHA